MYSPPWERPALDPASETAPNETTPNASDASEDDDNNSSDGRDNFEQIDSESGEWSPASTSSARALQPADQDAPAERAEPVITQEWVAERFAMMFVIGAAGPAASGRKDVLRKVTGRVVSLAWKYIDDKKSLPKDHIDALSKSFGNFDRVVALGWLLGDAVGLPLMERTEAHVVGLKAKYEAGKIKSQEASIPRDAKKAAGRLKAADPQRQQLLKDAEKAVEELLHSTVELPLPKATQPPAPRPSGSRKRAREPEPSVNDVIAEAVADVLQAGKAVKRAAAAMEKADKEKEEAKAKVA